MHMSRAQSARSLGTLVGIIFKLFTFTQDKQKGEMNVAYMLIQWPTWLCYVVPYILSLTSLQCEKR